MKNKKYPARKLKWQALQITRVKLNPEQAVLACCDASTKLARMPTSQCDGLYYCPGAGAAAGLSS